MNHKPLFIAVHFASYMEVEGGKKRIGSLIELLEMDVRGIYQVLLLAIIQSSCTRLSLLRMEYVHGYMVPPHVPWPRNRAWLATFRHLNMYTQCHRIPMIPLAHGRPRPSLTAFATWLVLGRFSIANYWHSLSH